MATPPGRRAPDAQIPIPHYAPQIEQTPGLFSRIATATGNALKYIGGAAASVATTLFVFDIKEYKENFNDETNSFVEHFANGLVDFLKADSAFLRGVASGSDELPFISKGLVLHALTSLTKNSRLKNVLRAAIEKLVEVITKYNPPDNLAEIFHSFRHGDTAHEKEQAQKELERIFKPLAENIALTAGLDEESLKSVVRYGSGWLANSVKSYLIKQCIDFYEKVVDSAHLPPAIENAIDTMPMGSDELKKLSETAAKNARPQILSSLKEHSALIAAKINETVATNFLSGEDQIYLANELGATFKSNTTASTKLWDFVQEYMQRTTYNGFAHIATKDPHATGSALERVQKYIAKLVLNQQFDPVLSQKIADFQKRVAHIAAAEKELTALIGAGKDPDAIELKTKQLKELQKDIDIQKQGWLRQAFRPMIHTLLADMGYSKASDLPIPTLFQDAIWKNLIDTALPDLLMSYYPQLANDPLSILAEKLVKEIPPLKGAHKDFVIHFASGLQNFIQKKLAEKPQFIDDIAKKFAVDPDKVQSFLQAAATKTSSSAKEVSVALTTHLFSHLNVHDSPNVIAGSLETILTSVTEFAKEAEIALKYKKYKEAVSENEKKAALTALQNSFAPLITKLIKQAGCDATGLKAVLNYGSEAFADILKDFLTDQCIEMYECLIVKTELTAEENAFVEGIGGKNELEIACRALAEQAGPHLLTLLEKQSIAIAESTNNELVLGQFSPVDEAVLGKEFQAIFRSREAPFDAIWKFGQQTIARLINKGLIHLAMNSPLKTGDAKQRIEAYLTAFFQKHFSDIDKTKDVHEFLEATISLRDAQAALEALKKQAIEKAPNLSQKLQTDIETKTKEVKELSERYKKRRDAIQQLFKPLVKEILHDFGYEKAADLQVTKLMQDSIWESLSERALPDLLVDSFGKLHAAINDIQRPLRERDEHAAHMKPSVVGTARPFAKLCLKQLQASAIVGASDWSALGIKEVSKQLQEKEQSQIAAHELLEVPEKEIGEWAGDRLPKIIAAIQKKEYGGKALEDILEALFVQIFDNFSNNIKKIQEENPEAAFAFTLAAANDFNEHLALINKITQEQNVSHMYKVDPLVMVKEFEKEGKLDKALPGFKAQSEAHEHEEIIKKLQGELYQLESQEANELRDADIANIKERLKQERSNLEKLQIQAEERMKDEFYNNFSPYIMSLCGFTKAEDLPVPKEMQHELWKLLENKLGPTIMLEALKTALQPDMLNKYLQLIAETINESLKSQETTPQKVETDPEMIETCSKLLEQLLTALPGTVIGGITNISKIRDPLIAPKIATAMRTALKDYDFSALFEDSIVKAAASVPDQLKALDKIVTKTAAEIKAQREYEARQVLKSYREQAGDTIFSVQESIINSIGNSWKNFQKSFDSAVKTYLGDATLYVKSFLDKICRFVFIDLILYPLYVIFSIPVGFIYFLYSLSLRHHAEHLRKNAVEVPMHANALLQVARRFQHHFPAELLAHD
jgi:hypothetical protein